MIGREAFKEKISGPGGTGQGLDVSGGGWGADYVEKQVIVFTRLLEIEDCVCLCMNAITCLNVCVHWCVSLTRPPVCLCKNLFVIRETRFHADMLSDTYKCVCPVYSSVNVTSYSFSLSLFAFLRPSLPLFPFLSLASFLSLPLRCGICPAGCAVCRRNERSSRE